MTNICSVLFFSTNPFPPLPLPLPLQPKKRLSKSNLKELHDCRLRATSKANPDGVRRSRQRDRAMRGIPAPEANAELQANLDVCQISCFFQQKLSFYFHGILQFKLFGGENVTLKT